VPRKITPEQFRAEMRAIHAGKPYSFSVTQYRGARQPVRVRCRRHGVWTVVAAYLRQGSGCPTCGRKRGAARHRVSPDDFRAEVEKVHAGNPYDFSVTRYRAAKELVKVRCKRHGLFSIRAHHLRDGRGCQACAREEIAARRRKTTAEFKAEIRMIHGNRVRVAGDYTGANNPIPAVCVRHPQGTWKASPPRASSLIGKKPTGCPDCAREGNQSGDRVRARWLKKFLSEATGLPWASTTDYSRIERTFKNHVTPATFGCRNHGARPRWYTQAPQHHLRGKGCPACWRSSIADAQRMGMPQFLDECRRVMGDEINEYRFLGQYAQSLKPIEVEHLPCGSRFYPTPSNFLHGGSRCPTCAIYGFDVAEPATLYYLRLPGIGYKIGVTNRSVEDRYRAEATPYRALYEKLYRTGAAALRAEREILEFFCEDLIDDGELATKATGTTEVFLRDVLGLGRRKIRC